MATTEPGQQFVFDQPVEKAGVDAVLMRALFTALAQTNRTTDATFPDDARPGMLRINAATANIKFEVFEDGAWRTIAQNVQAGVAAPAKQVVLVDTPATTWTIDHNLGSQPLVQVFDPAFRAMDSVHTFQRDHLSFGRVNFNAPGLVAGPMGISLARYEGRIIEVYGVSVDGVSGVGVAATIQWEIDKTPSGGLLAPLTGGLVTIATGGHPQGTVFPGTAVTAANLFGGPLLTPGTEDIIRATAAAPPAVGVGSVELYAVVERMLGPNQYHLDHPTVNRIVITHPQPTTGSVVLVG